MKILFLCSRLEMGGAERQMCLLAAGLQARGHQVQVAVFYPGGPLASFLASAGVAVHCLDKAGRYDLLPTAWRLRRLIRAWRPQVLHAYLDTPNLLAAALHPFTPGLKVVWGLRTSRMDFSRYDRFAGQAHRQLPRLARWADLVLLNSRAGAAYHQELGIPGSKMRVIPNGIDTDLYRFDPQGRQALRKEWGLDDRHFLAGLVGRLDPVKDHQSLIQAAATLRTDWPHLRLVMVGSGDRDYSALLERQARELGMDHLIIWAGQRHDLPPIYSALEVCVLPSAYGEGFANALGEAMACGRPCLATRVGDSALVLGQDALLIPPQDPAALAAALGRLRALEPASRQSLGDHLRRRVEENFSLPVMVSATEQALLDLLEPRP